MRTRFEASLGGTKPLYAGFTMLVVLVVAIFVFVGRRSALYADVDQTYQERGFLSRAFIDLLEAETGQRGYLLTSDTTYKAPYDAAVGRVEADFKRLWGVAEGGAIADSEIEALHAQVAQKIAELRATIELHDNHQSAEALALVKAGTGKAIMDRIRDQVDELRLRQRTRIAGRLETARREGEMLAFVAVITVMTAFAVAVASLGQLRTQIAQISAAGDDLRQANQALASEAEQRAKLADQLRQSQKMEAIGQLTGGLAHDFNNMLAVIVSSVELAKRHLAKKDGNPHRFLDSALAGADRAATLTHRLLAFSRQQPLAPQSIDPNRMVASMAEILHRTLGEVIRLETVLGAGLWRAFADPTQLENAILNLAVNARDAMENGGKLTIETNNAYLDDDYAAKHLGIPAGQYVLIAISDTGFGIPPEIIERIFDPFFTTKGVGKGTGLGLSQVYGFVRQSGGHIKVYSEPGQGTTVKVYLPRYYGAEALEPVGMPAGPEPRGSLEETILVVEDDDNVRQLAVDSLMELGYKVIPTPGPAAALRELGKGMSVDVLFTDVVMPDMNGRKLAEEARKQRPDLKILFTTGYSQNAIVHGGILDPGVDLIVKPYPVDKLARKIRELLDRAV
jgi:signal transduction histidine kinase